MGGPGAVSPPKKVFPDVAIQIVGELPEGAAPPGLTDRVKEGVAHGSHAPWRTSSVLCEFKDGNTTTVIEAPVDATGAATFPAEAATGALSFVTASGPHTDRQLFSLVAQPGTAIATAPIPLTAGQTTRVKISTRARVSIWSTPSRVTAANVKGARGLIDDLSLQGTFTNSVVPDSSSGLPDLTFSWDPTVATLPAKTDAEKQAFYQNIIRVCHKEGVQCLVAYALANNPPKDPKKPPANAQARSFQKWVVEVTKLRSATDRTQSAMQAEIDKLADRIVTFVYGSKTQSGNLPDADGITFDIEHVASGTSAPFVEQGDVFTRLYTAIAKDDRLVRRRAIVGVAVGEFTAGPASRASGTLRQRFDSPGTMGFARAHPYEMAKGCPNMILRPMAFGDLSGTTDRAELRLWFKDIVDFALDTVGLHPGQFQLGVRLGEELAFPPGPDGKPDKTRRGTPTGLILTTGSEMSFLLTSVLRPSRIGLITFALSDVQIWANYQFVAGELNAGEAPANTIGQPVQVPVSIPVS